MGGRSGNDVSGDSVKQRGHPDKREYHVFAAPNQDLLDRSWLEADGSQPKSPSKSLIWRVNRFHASMHNESREAVLAKREPAADALIEVRRSIRTRLAPRDLEPSTDLVLLELPSDRPQATLQHEHSSPTITAAIPDKDADEDLDALSAKGIPEDRSEATSDTTHCDKRSFTPKDVVELARTKAALGPARRVGISCEDLRKRPTFLRTLERSRRHNGPTLGIIKAQNSDENRSDSISTGVSKAQSRKSNHITMLSSDPAITTTFDSIPPPPSHNFNLSALSDIGRLLRSPGTFLSINKGGAVLGDAPSLSVLVVVTRLEPIEQITCSKTAGLRSNVVRRCEMVVRDRNRHMIKVVLEGQCASRWADTVGDDTSYFTNKNRHRTGLRSQAATSLLRNQSFEDSTPQIDKQDTLLPIRPGDVIALSDLRLSRSKSKAMEKVSSNASKDLGLSIHLTASPTFSSSLELCWRNEMIDEHDDLVNFDPSLTAFDSRCRAIYELARSWCDV
jgi:hypothetical protein